MNPEEVVPEVAETGGTRKKTRRVWNQVEEDILLKCMINEYGEKWAGDYGFRGGFFKAVEKELAKVLPNANIKANPHIDSKVRAWKTTYHKIVDITNRSGFAWDHTYKRIVVDEPSVWTDFEKANPEMEKGMNMRPFPYFDQWVILLGNDRATGAGAEGLTEMATPDVPIVDEYVYRPCFDFDFDGSHANETPPPIHTTTPSPSTPTPPTFTPHSSLPTAAPQAVQGRTNAAPKKGKKRARMTEEEESMHASMNNFMLQTLSHMESMSNSMGFEKILSERRKNVQKELEKLNITTTQKFKVSNLICKEDQRLDNWDACKPEERQEFVDAIIYHDLYGPF